jgi:hypothetical protein
MTVGSGLSLSDDETEQRPQNYVIRQLIEGRSNAVGTCTLTASHAAAVAASTYVSAVLARQFTVTHPSNANADKDFYFVCLG